MKKEAIDFIIEQNKKQIAVYIESAKRDKKAKAFREQALKNEFANVLKKINSELRSLKRGV